MRKLKPTLNAGSDIYKSTTEQVNSKRIITQADITALRGGDTSSYDKIYRAWYNPIYLILIKLTGSQVEAQDIAQNVFTNLWLSREKLDPEKKLNTFLYKMARNSAISYFRHKRVTDNYLNSVDRDNMSSSDSPDDLVIEKEMELLKKMALSQMPATQREIFKLSHEEGLSNDEIAKKLGVTKETVYSLKSRARKQLEDLLRLITILFFMP